VALPMWKIWESRNNKKLSSPSLKFSLKFLPDKFCLGNHHRYQFAGERPENVSVKIFYLKFALLIWILM